MILPQEKISDLSSSKQADYLKELNPPQLEAVLHTEGPLLVFAGAGSGKTRVLTHRIANLVLEHNVNPSRILAVTFTNKAANEMKQRLANLFCRDSVPLWAGTFHSCCASILRRYAQHLGYTSNFAIYDTSDSLAALKRVFNKLNIDPRFIEPKTVALRIDRAKNEYQFADAIRTDRYLPEAHAHLVADLYENYQQELLSANAMDFGDLLCNVVTLFKLEPLILEQYQELLEYISVDEYQDTNKVQYLLIKMLTQKRKNICVVGDDDQSIYAFRGATIENILSFKRDFPNAKVVTLDINYRSSQNILTAANAIISKNIRRQKKVMKTPNQKGHLITAYKGYAETDEAEFVSREISKLLQSRVSPKDIAIFYRTNAQSRALEEELSENGIPYEIYGGQRFYERKEIKDLLAYLRLVINENDNEAFLRIINTPSRGLGATTIGNLIAFAEQKQIALFPALKLIISEKPSNYSAAQYKRFADFIELISMFQDQAKETELALAKISDENAKAGEILTALPDFLRLLAEQSTYLAKLKAEDSIEAESRIENLHELFGVAGEFVSRAYTENRKIALRDFLERASLCSDADRENITKSATSEKEQAAKPSVSLMTLHLAKGLEFEFVFFVGLEEGLMPHIRSFESKKELEEERRLCYVGITRAKKQLYLTRASTRQRFGQASWYTGQPSRFLFDLPKNLIEERGSGFLNLF